MSELAVYPNGDESARFSPEALAQALVEKIEVNPYFLFSYQSAIMQSIIQGEANLVGKFVDDNYLLTIDLNENFATLKHDDEDIAFFPLDQETFNELLGTYRARLAVSGSVYLTLEELAQQLTVATGVGEHYYNAYWYSVLTAAIHGDCRLIDTNKENVLELTVHLETSTVSLYRNEVVIGSYNINLESFNAVIEEHAGLFSAE